MDVLVQMSDHAQVPYLPDILVLRGAYVRFFNVLEEGRAYLVSLQFTENYITVQVRTKTTQDFFGTNFCSVLRRAACATPLEPSRNTSAAAGFIK